MHDDKVDALGYSLRGFEDKPVRLRARVLRGLRYLLVDRLSLFDFILVIQIYAFLVRNQLAYALVTFFVGVLVLVILKRWQKIPRWNYLRASRGYARYMKERGRDKSKVALGSGPAHTG